MGKATGNLISMCKLCYMQYKVIPTIDDNGDEHEHEEGHAPDCLFHNIDVKNKKYVTEEEINNWKPFDMKAHMASLPKTEDKPKRRIMFNDGTVSYR